MSYTKVPNIIFELKLIPAAHFLYLILLRISQDEIENYFDFNKKFAKDWTSMKIKKYALNELCKPFDILGGKPLIKIQKGEIQILNLISD
jgi:hypothetical protein